MNNKLITVLSLIAVCIIVCLSLFTSKGSPFKNNSSLTVEEEALILKINIIYINI